MKQVYNLKNQIEAQVIKGALEQAGIRCVIRSFEDSAYNGVFIPQKGYGVVLVEEEDEDRAREIIGGINSKS